MPLATLTDRQITANVRRLREANVTQGRPYSLAELLAEQHRRASKQHIDVRLCARTIIELSAGSPDGFVRYGELWQRLFPDQPWAGNHSVRVIGDVLNDVGFFCVRSNLPLIITLVINKAAGVLTEAAKANIHHTWTERGTTSGTDRDAWIADHQRRALTLTTQEVPADDRTDCGGAYCPKVPAR